MVSVSRRERLSQKAKYTDFHSCCDLLFDSHHVSTITPEGKLTTSLLISTFSQLCQDVLKDVSVASPLPAASSDPLSSTNQVLF